MNYKKYIIILIISIIIFFILIFIYYKLIDKKEFVNCYVLNEDVNKGEILSKEKISVYKIEKDTSQNILDIIALDDFEGIVFKNDMQKGNIILRENVCFLKEYEEDDEKEYISIKVNNICDSVSNNINLQDKVNIYYVAKSEQIADIINIYPKEDMISMGVKDPYSIIRIIKNIKIYDAFNKNGKSIYNQENLESDTLIDSIVVKVDKNMAMQISILRKYGEFCFSIIK